MPNARTLASGGKFTPKSVKGLALWLDASDPQSLYTTDAGPVTVPPGFEPQYIGSAACVGHWDASVADTIQLGSGNTVVNIDDLSGNDHYAQQTTPANRPILVSNALNGLPVIRFSGSTGLAGNLDNYNVTSAARTVVVVCKITGAVNNGRVFSAAPASPAADFATGGLIPCCTNLTSTTTLTSYTSTNASPVAGFDSYQVFVGRASGTSVINRSAGSSGASSAYIVTQLATRFGIGCAAHDQSSKFIGDIAEVLFFDGYVSDADVVLIEKHLATKWGLSGGHIVATGSGTQVGYWKDKSGNGRHATQATSGSRPTVSGTLQGGKAQVAFASATNNFLGTASASLSPPFSFLAVVQKATRGINTFLGSGDSTRLQFGDGSATYSGAYYAASRVAGAVYGSAPIATARAQVVSAVASSGSLPGSLSMWADSVGGAASVVTAGTAPSYALGNPIQIGSQSSTSWGGTVCEVIAYSKALSTTERLKLQRYLAAKWNAALSPIVSNADAQDWINRVYMQGGSVSRATADIVNTFCNSIDAAGLRDRFYRLNLFCGNSDGAVAAARVPLYRNWGAYSGRNLQRYGDNISGSNWTKSGCTAVASSTERPFDYGPFATQVTATAGTAVSPYVVNTSATYSAGTITVSVYVKPAGQSYARLLLSGSSGMTFPGGGSVAYATIHTGTGEVSSVLAGATATSSYANNGWWRLSLTVAIGTAGNMAIRVDVGNGVAYNAAGTESILLWGVQSEVGSTATAFDPYPLGGATEENTNFVPADYAETGATGGLKSDGTKYLRTGLTPAAMPALATGHLSVFTPNVFSLSGTQAMLSSLGSGFSNNFAIEANRNGAGNLVGSWGDGVFTDLVTAANGSGNGHILISRQSSTALRAFKNGSQIGSTRTTSVTPAAGAGQWALFGQGYDGGTGVLAGDRCAGIIGMYSIGAEMTQAQALSFASIVSSFNTAMGRA